MEITSTHSEHAYSNGCIKCAGLAGLMTLWLRDRDTVIISSGNRMPLFSRHQVHGSAVAIPKGARCGALMANTTMRLHNTR